MNGNEDYEKKTDVHPLDQYTFKAICDLSYAATVHSKFVNRNSVDSSINI